MASLSARLKRLLPLGIAALAVVLLSGLFRAVGSEPNQTPLQWTSVVMSPLTPQAEPVLGVDGKYHAVYELEVMNTSPVTATLKQIVVLDGRDPDRVLATYEGRGLLTRLRTLNNREASTPAIELNGTRLVLVDIAFDSRDAIPPRLLHRLDLLGATGPAQTVPSPLSYTAAPIALRPQVPVIRSPLAGKGWVAINGCCQPDVGHRSTGLPINGRLYFAQRFAIDWMQLDDQGRIAHGDLAQVESYVDFGADVLAVADGKVVDTLNSLPEQVPPNLPDPKTINLDNGLGNHVILDLGNSVFALYAHLQPESVTVKPGDRVRRGQVLGKLGNTGNTSAPHLHFHVMNGPTIGSDGLPYLIDRFDVVGQIPLERAEAFYQFEGDWSNSLLPHPSPRRDQFPLYMTIVDFPR
jgi:hypothetical protein